jgi:cytochrome c-type biogenesis protein CcmH/NrfG
VEELLGDLHLESCRPAEALAPYRRSLELHPRRLNSLIGAARAAMAVGSEEEAGAFDAALMQTGVRASDRPGWQQAVGDRGASTH